MTLRGFAKMALASGLSMDAAITSLSRLRPKAEVEAVVKEIYAKMDRDQAIRESLAMANAALPVIESAPEPLKDDLTLAAIRGLGEE